MKITRSNIYIPICGILTFLFMAVINNPVFSAPPDQRLTSAHQGCGASEMIISPWQTDDVSWMITTNAGLPFGRASGGAIGDHFYIFGAMDFSLGQAYNWTTEHWQTIPEPPLGNCNWCGVAADEDIYLIGRYAAYTFGSEVQKYTPIGEGPEGTWSNVADYPLAASGIAADWDGGNYIYAAGGSNLVEVFDEAYRYNIAADEWSEIASLPVPMTYHGGAFLEGKFHAAGGVEEGGVAHYVYDPSEDEWTQQADIPTPNYFALFNFFANEDYLFSIGGGGGYAAWPATNAVQLYDPDTDEWFQETPTLAMRGLNTADMMPNGEVLTAGGFFEWIYFQQAFIGSGFPTGGSYSGIGDNLESCIPAEMEFYPAWPNPFNPAAVLSFRLGSAGQVTLVIYDSSGREVSRVLDGSMPAGLHSVNYSLDGGSTGLYFARLTAGDKSFCQKLIFVK